MRRTFGTISVIGLGYIGLPTAAIFASRKVRVVGVDINEQTVETVNRGEVHIVEPDLDIAVQSAVQQGYLRAAMTPEPAEAFLIAVPTPFKGRHHDPDLSYIRAATQSIAPVLAPGNLVVLESTCPVGTTEQMAKWLEDARPDLTFPQTHGDSSDVRIAHCPERVLPGKVMRELIHNDRVVGGLSPRCSEMAAALYRTFVDGDCVITDARTAEMTKLTENTFRDVNIAFANELSVVCDKLGVDVWELIRLANRHPRVNILQPGPGVGGHCIAVDPWFIVSAAPNEAQLIRQARQVNDAKPEWVLNKVRHAIDECLEVSPTKKEDNIVVAIYGLTFKPDIDDLRESPALKIAQDLSDFYTVRLIVVEPFICMCPDSLRRASLLKTEDAYNIADIHLMLVDHTEFRKDPPPKGIVIDVRGVWK